MNVIANDAQKRYLRARAHQLRPIVIVGQGGLTAGVAKEIENSLLHHELMKIRVNAEDRDARYELIAEICEQTGAQLIQVIGHVATVFRANPENPRITLPKP